MDGLELKFVGSSWYLGAYLGPWEDLEAWVKPKVEAWTHGVRTLDKIYMRHPQYSYYGLGILLQL